MDSADRESLLSLSKEEQLVIRELRRGKAMAAIKEFEAINSIVDSNNNSCRSNGMDGLGIDKKAHVVLDKDYESKACTFVPFADGSHNCMMCSARFQSDSAAKEHVNEHHFRLSRYRCSACGYGNWSEDKVKLHVETSHKSAAPSEIPLRPHMPHSSKPRDKKTEAGAREPRSSLKRPLEAAPPSSPQEQPKRVRFEQDQKGPEVPTKRVTLNGETVQFYNCPHCSRIFYSESQVLAHLKDKHQADTGSREAEAGGGDEIEARLAFHKTTYEKAFRKLVEARPVEMKAGRCPYEGCQVDLPGAYEARMHYGAKHFNLKRYQCLDCLQIFKSSVTLRGHFSEFSREQCRLKGDKKRLRRPAEQASAVDVRQQQQQEEREEEQGREEEAASVLEKDQADEIDQRYYEQKEVYQAKKKALMESLPYALRTGKCKYLGCNKFFNNGRKHECHYLNEHSKLNRWTCFDCGLDDMKTNTALRKHYKDSSKQKCVEQRSKSVSGVQPKAVSSSLPDMRNIEERYRDQTTEYSMRRARILEAMPRGPAPKECGAGGCGYSARSMVMLESHYVEAHGNLSRWSCFDCRDTLDSQDALMDHFRRYNIDQCIQMGLKKDQAAEGFQQKTQAEIKREQTEAHEETTEPTQEDLATPVTDAEDVEMEEGVDPLENDESGPVEGLFQAEQ